MLCANICNDPSMHVKYDNDICYVFFLVSFSLFYSHKFRYESEFYENPYANIPHFFVHFILIRIFPTYFPSLLILTGISRIDVAYFFISMEYFDDLDKNNIKSSPGLIQRKILENTPFTQIK